MTALLEARELVKVLGRGELQQRVLHKVSLRIEPGEFVALTGASGSGKSTLLYLLGALDRPDSGEVLFEGRALGGMDDEARATFRGRHLGYVFQFHFLLPELDVLENVAVPMLRQGLDEEDANARATSALEQVGLADLRRRKPGQLSGGQQQRVAIARAIAHRPRLVLADEPTGALDSKNAAAVIAALRHLSQVLGTTVVMVTHDNDLAAACDRRVILADGRVVHDGVRAPAPVPPPAPTVRDLSSRALEATGEHLAAMLQLADEADAETVVRWRDDPALDLARTLEDPPDSDPGEASRRRKDPPR
jgi:lipoprotein-releasing system ATP-binding protein